jgi:hypothetical protein
MTHVVLLRLIGVWSNPTGNIVTVKRAVGKGKKNVAMHPNALGMIENRAFPLAASDLSL